MKYYLFHVLMFKWIFIFTFATCMRVSATGYSQGTRISLDIKNMELKKVFSILQKKGKIHLLYSSELLPSDRSVNLQVKDEPVLDVLNKLLVNTGLKYKVLNEELVVIAPEGSENNDTHVKGRVTDDTGKPLPGVSVVIEGAKKGVSTDANGEYEIDVPDNGRLIFSYVGYINETVSVGDRQRIDLVLKINPVQSNLNDVVVVGYGSQRRLDITGSVASVPKSRLSQLPVTNILHAIEGSVAGITITQNSSVPGSSASILIRGQNSISASTTPLIVVDGIPFSTTGGGTNDINPNDIASIEVLKDASAVAIYGTRGSNGVILITTKRGTSGKAVIRYNGYGGVEGLAHVLKPRDGASYVQKYADYMKQTGQTQTSPVPNASELPNYNAGRTTDWIKEATHTGVLMDHNLSIAGGTKDVRYYLSGEYLKERGAIKGYQYQRASLRSNLDINITSFLTAGTSLFFTNNNYDGGRANLLLATAMSPYAQEYDAHGNYNIYPMYPELLYTNPLLGLYTDQLNRSSTLSGNGYGELKLGGVLKGLKYRVNLAYTYVPSRVESYTGRDANSTIGSASAFNSEIKTWLVENILTYTRDWDKHHIDFTGLYSAQQNDYSATAVNANTFINDQLSFNLLGAGANVSGGSIYVNAGTLSSVSTTNAVVYNGSLRLQSNILSQMGRLNYSYDSRYLFTATVRRDGYSAFGSSTSKYGAFPSVAVGWNISNEDFMKSLRVVDALKLRLSYGKSGNQAIDPNGTATTENTARSPFNGISTVGVLANTLGNKNLHWESTVGFNAAVDFSVLKNRISGTVEFYKTRTYDIVLKRNLPIITGYSSIYDNLGKMQNKGVELTLNTRNVDGRDFRWETVIVFSANQNKLLDLYGDKKSDVGNKWFIGHPLGVIYDYKMAGIWQTGEDPSKWDPGAKPGDLKFADINGNGKISADSDRIIVGQTRPKWIGSFTNTFHYKNWHLNIFIQTAQGMMKNNPDLNYVDESGRRNTPAEVGYWTTDNKNNTRPALSYTNTRGYGYASDASYTRIKDVTLSYTMTQAMAEKLGLGSVTFYLSGRNLKTFTHWIGWDPENDYQMRGTGDWTNNYPVIRSFVFGANISLR